MLVHPGQLVALEKILRLRKSWYFQKFNYLGYYLDVSSKKLVAKEAWKKVEVIDGIHTPCWSAISYPIYLLCSSGDSWIHSGMCVKYQTCEPGRSKMCFCLVWCLLLCSTGGGGPACFNIEKVVCATIIMRKNSYPFAKPNIQVVVLKSGLGTHSWWLTGIALVLDPGTSEKVLGFKLTGVHVKALPALPLMNLTWWSQCLASWVCCCAFKK